MISLTVFLFVAFLMLFLAGVVFVHDPKNAANKAFVSWVVFTFLWMTFNFLENATSLSYTTRTVFLHGDFFVAAISSGLILIFVLRLIYGRVRGRLESLAIAPALLAALISLTPWLFDKVYIAEDGVIRFIEGALYWVYAPLIVVYLIFSNILLFHSLARRKSHQRAQLVPVTIGLTISTVVALTINLYFQNTVSADIFRIGIYIWVIFIFGVAWSIGRHKFLNVKFITIDTLLLGVVATMVARTLGSASAGEVAINIASLIILLILGFAMIRSFLKESKQREELEDMTKRLRVVNKRLRKLDDLKTTMVSIASHQLRGPLGGMRGYLTMFRDGDLGHLTDKQLDVVKMNLNTLTRLMNAVETFLDITKLEAGKLVLRKEVLPLDDAVRDVAHEFEIMLNRKGLKLVTEIERHVWVDFDPEKIKHVIFNLVDNAMKYTEEGTITVKLWRDSKDAVITVTDTGKGMMPEEVPRLFGKYERGELVVDRGGSGLGLYVVKMLTEMQGGSVSASSPGLDKGSTFTVKLPLAKQQHS